MSSTQNDAPAVLVLSSAVTPSDIPRLCEGMRGVLENFRGATVICDVGAICQPDASIVDVIARLQLTAKRRGCVLWLRDVRPRLRELIDLAGLQEALPTTKS